MLAGGALGLARLRYYGLVGSEPEKARIKPPRREGICSPRREGFASPSSVLSIGDVYEQAEKASCRRLAWVSCACLLAYLVVGTYVYGYGPIEKWGAARALYFSMVTLTTVGFGDLTPEGERARLFTAFFAIAGVLITGLAVSELFAHLQESQARQAEEWDRDFIEAMARGGHRGRAVSELSEETHKGSHSSRLVWCLVLYHALLPLLLVNIVGAGAIGLLEGWSATDVLYYGVVTSSTIGYGDLHPSRPASYVVAIIYIPLAACSVGNAISTLTRHIMHEDEKRRRLALLDRPYTYDALFEMDEDSDGMISKWEFTVHLLKLWGLVDDVIMAAITRRFAELERDGALGVTPEDFCREILGGQQGVPKRRRTSV